MKHIPHKMMAALAALSPTMAFAASGALPWEGPLCMVMNSLSSPVATAAAIIAIVVTGLLIAFGEMKGVFSVMMRILFGLSIALLAGTWMLDIFGLSTTCSA